MQGGWYAVLRVPATRPDEDLAIALLETKNVYVHPGHFYDFPADGHLVVSLITPQNDFREGYQSVDNDVLIRTLARNSPAVDSAPQKSLLVSGALFTSVPEFSYHA